MSDHLLFIDIETAPVASKLTELPEGLQKHWLHKKQFLRLNEREEADDELAFRRHAGIFAEWSKVIVIGLGYQKGNTLRLKAFTHEDEKALLSEFKEVVTDFCIKGDVWFCGHNIKEFDIPFLCRRMLVNGIKLPSPLDIGGLKPWEVHHMDTMKMWSFGDYKRYTSLDLMAQTFGIESSKTDEIDGSMVADFYYDRNGLDKIVDYCLRDVFVTAQLYFKLRGDFERKLVAEYV